MLDNFKIKNIGFIMNCVGPENDLIAQPIFPMWKELPEDITFEVLFHMNPLDYSRCCVACKQWEQFLTDNRIWQPLSRYHFPSMSPEVFKSFQVFQRFYSNLFRGVCSVKTILVHGSGVYGLALGDGALFSSSLDKAIKIWDLRKNTCTKILYGHVGSVVALAVRDGTLFSGSTDKTIKIWDLENNTCTATLRGHDGLVNALAVRDGTLFSGSDDQTIKIWDLRNNTCTATLSGHGGEIFAFAAGDGALFSGSNGQTIKIWDLRKNTCTETLSGHGDLVRVLAVRDKTLFSGSNDQTIKIWDLENNTCIATLSGHRNSVRALAVRDRTLFSGSNDKTIKIWDLEGNTCTATLSGHDGPVQALALKGGTLFSGSNDCTIKVWDFTAGHSQIFMEIASALESQNEKEATFAMERFSKMPKAAQAKVFGELHKILHPELSDYSECAEDAFYGQNGQGATNAQRAQAIKNYLIGH